MTNRRSFLKYSVATAAGTMILGKVTLAGESNDAKEDSQEAKNVNYHVNKSAIKDPKLMQERQGVAFKEQKCSNCGLYQGKPTDKKAPCPVLANKLVSGEGWCASWNKRPPTPA